MNTNYLMKKKNFNLFYKVFQDFSFKIYFSFSFCSYFNLEVTVVKTDKIRGLQQLFTPSFLLIGKKKFSKIINNNYHIAHQKNHIKNNNGQTFN